tara:strand:- start:1 stop:714 length:714 start_codon:yes stop_codon:yes gene_type:complete
MEANSVTSISQLPTNNNYQNNPLQQNMQQNQNNIILNKNDTLNESTTQIMNQNPNPNSNPNANANANANAIPALNQETNNVVQNNPNYNELINQLQQASSQGITQLPSRDIPMNPTQTANDVEIKPNFVPPPPRHEDYIQNMQTPDELVNQNNKQIIYQNNLEQFYSTIQLPLIVSLLYFIFQLPYFRQFIKKMLPSLFGNDGNMNLYGFFFNSVLFGVLFFVINNLISNLTMYVNN